MILYGMENKIRVPDAGNWKLLTDPTGNPRPVPNASVSGFAYDDRGYFPILWRSERVRSAKNCWSLPSGLHEIGLYLSEQFCEELKEELNLTPIEDTVKIVGTYENIALCDAYHWVIQLMTVKVETLSSIINKEPDKHTEFQIVHFSELLKDDMYKMAWAPNLKEAIYSHRYQIVKAITESLTPEYSASLTT